VSWLSLKYVGISPSPTSSRTLRGLACETSSEMFWEVGITGGHGDGDRDDNCDIGVDGDDGDRDSARDVGVDSGDDGDCDSGVAK
jgi:hypothetical protein